MKKGDSLGGETILNSGLKSVKLWAHYAFILRKVQANLTTFSQFSVHVLLYEKQQLNARLRLWKKNVSTNVLLLFVPKKWKSFFWRATFRCHSCFVSLFLFSCQISGKSVGLVTTTRITHATPAGAYANIPERDWESDYDMRNAGDCGIKDIALQLVEDTKEIQVKLANEFNQSLYFVWVMQCFFLPLLQAWLQERLKVSMEEGKSLFWLPFYIRKTRFIFSW